ncbi:MAG: efflux RND transporter periplasmic adaptor subunit [Bacteroidetes bacterium]|nr:efflux RND transporter periplasmic adaptor subunit [Bacteroidota bacterium]
MRRFVQYIWISAVLMVWSCKKEENTLQTAAVAKPTVSADGITISFADTIGINGFLYYNVAKKSIRTDLVAPGRVVAEVVHSSDAMGQNLVLFDNPDLTYNYTEMLQHLININKQKGIIAQKKVILQQKKLQLARVKDLADNQAATGQDLTNAQIEVTNAETEVAQEVTALENEKTSLLEHETRLKLAGFDPKSLVNAKQNATWVICELPENQFQKVTQGQHCFIQFPAFNDKKFEGRIEEVGEVVDNLTRLVKLRVAVINPSSILKAGMFGSVHFGVAEGDFITVPREALVVVQGKQYVFVKTKERTFVRREVMAGQPVENAAVIFAGLQPSDQVVTQGAMQLKGLSFGY